MAREPRDIRKYSVGSEAERDIEFGWNSIETECGDTCKHNLRLVAFSVAVNAAIVAMVHVYISTQILLYETRPSALIGLRSAYVLETRSRINGEFGA